MFLSISIDWVILLLKGTSDPLSLLKSGSIIVISSISISKIEFIVSLIPMSCIFPKILPITMHFSIDKFSLIKWSIRERHLSFACYLEDLLAFLYIPFITLPILKINLHFIFLLLSSLLIFILTFRQESNPRFLAFYI